MQITLYDIAQRFVGMKEVRGSVDNPAIMAMLTLDAKWPSGDEVPWCSAAMNYWAWILNLPRSKSLRARSWLDVGIPVNEADVVVGFCVVVLWRGDRDGTAGHVGMFSGWDGNDRVFILGGNQGDAVSIVSYSKDRVLGYRSLKGSTTCGN